MAFSIHEESKNFRRIIGAEADMQAITIVSGGTTYEIEQAMPQAPQTGRDGIGEGEVVVNTQKWLVWVADMPIRPKLDDVLTEVETGRKFRIQSVDLTCGRGRWDITVTAEVPTGEPAV